MDVSRYKTFLFDCDGVLLDTNALKSSGFYEVALPYGKKCAEALKNYHQRHGGISRYEKMRYFITDILKRSYDKQLHTKLVAEYGNYCLKKMIQAEETLLMRDLLNTVNLQGTCFVVSGGKETELQQVFACKGLGHYFKGIFGSPRSKMEIVSDLWSSGMIHFPAVYIGDSQYDYIVAEKHEIDFVFMAGFTEFKDWRQFFDDKNVVVINTLADLIAKQ